MKFVRFASMSLALLVGMPGAALATNIKTIEILGVHLGMTEKQVVRVLSGRTNGPLNMNYTTCAGQTTTQVANNGCIFTISGSTKHGSINVGFVEDLPHRPHTSIVSSIDWGEDDLPNGNDTADRQYFASLRTRFGKPDMAWFHGGPAWCSPSPCHVDFSRQTLSNPQVAFIHFNGAAEDVYNQRPRLSIVDNALERAHQIAAEKAAAGDSSAKF